MNVATWRIEVGVRELKNNLSRYLDRVRDGEEVVVTSHGKPVARLSSVSPDEERLAELVGAGLIRPPVRTRRSRPSRRIEATGTVSDLVALQRR